MTQNKHEAALAIVRRAHRELGMDKATVALDLAYCMKHQALDLEQLYNFSNFDFAHDILGIHANLNHSTYELENCFLPRCAN